MPSDLRKRDWVMSAVTTLSAICPCPREFADQAYLFLRLPQAGLIPAVEGYVEIVARMAK